jgi:glycosyltransferase involved in cell wall biosynthesis
MKVAIDAGPLYGHRTGVGVATAGLFEALARRDDVELVPYLVSRRSTPQPGHRRLPVPGIVASHVWSRSDRPAADRWLREADLLHGTNYVAPPTRRPTVVSVYDGWFLRHPEEASPLVRRAGENLRRAVRRGAWIHTTCDATADHLRELLGTDRVVTVHLGVPATPPLESPTPPDRNLNDLAATPFVLAVGTEERRKDLPFLIDAFDHLAVDHPRTVLVLAGAPGDDSERIAAALGALAPAVRERVRRLGPVDETTKRWLLRHAALLAYPSRDEGFGFPVLEANALGTPVVAMAVGAIPEIAGEAAVLVESGERRPADFADAIAGVLGGSGRLGLIESGYRNVRRFDWDRSAGDLVELYRTVIEDAS